MSYNFINANQKVRKWAKTFFIYQIESEALHSIFKVFFALITAGTKRRVCNLKIT